MTYAPLTASEVDSWFLESVNAVIIPLAQECPA